MPKTRQKKVGGQKNEEVLFSNIRCYCNSHFSCLWGNKQADQKEDKEITVAVQLESSKDILEIAKKEAEKKGYKINIMEVSDNVAYNDAVQHDEADANFAQHQPFMEMFNKEKKLI